MKIVLRVLGTLFVGGVYVLVGWYGLGGLPIIAEFVASYPVMGYPTLFVYIVAMLSIFPFTFFAVADIWGFHPRIFGFGLRRSGGSV